MAASSRPDLWELDPDVTFLNHGSFGACPTVVTEKRFELLRRMEREPMRFFMHDLLGLHDEARAALARFVGSSPQNLVFVNNATSGVNTALRSLPLAEGDEILVTNQEYPACRNAADFIAARRRASVKVVQIPFPCQSEDDVVERVLGAVGPRTRYALLDYVTSQTGMVLPIHRLVAELKDRGVETVVDGAHAVGMVPLELDDLGAAYFTSNCHKWLCTPKGSAFLYVRPDFQETTDPLVISHGTGQERSDRPRLWVDFDWPGTTDPTAFLTIPTAIEYLGSVLPGGWDELRKRNRDLALQSRRLLCEFTGEPPATPDSMIGTLAAVRLPDGVGPAPGPPLYFDPLYEKLVASYRITVPIVAWPKWPGRLVRTSSQLYNRVEDTKSLVAALKELSKDPSVFSG